MDEKSSISNTLGQHIYKINKTTYSTPIYKIIITTKSLLLLYKGKFEHLIKWSENSVVTQLTTVPLSLA
jgi:hypothetical protein